MTTDERIENLLARELARVSRNRWLMVGAGLAAGFCVLAGAFGCWPLAGAFMVLGFCALAWVIAGTTSKVIFANAFILEDANRKARAMLVIREDGPALALFDENHMCRVVLRVDKDGPGLALADENSKDRICLEVQKDGLLGLGLHDENCTLRAWLAVTKDGPGLGLADENGKPIWQAPQSAPIALTPGTK